MAYVALVITDAMSVAPPAGSVNQFYFQTDRRTVEVVVSILCPFRCDCSGLGGGLGTLVLASELPTYAEATRETRQRFVLRSPTGLPDVRRRTT